MKDLKIVIDSTNREIYKKMLSNMIEVLKNQPKQQFYDNIMYRYSINLLDRISKTSGQRKITIQGIDQIVIAVSLAFSPDIAAQHVIGAVKNQMNYFVDDISTQYVHDIKSRKK